ncbi:flagellar assembly protein FliX [Falsiroseomonas sp. E2-1-a20]|uniref:flagellar assembly protein FliX n=1 Tax=Falsiroseomonas sp. E2-1-a20 TaxID=3239300 RepID=UPI003F322E97
MSMGPLRPTGIGGVASGRPRRGGAGFALPGQAAEAGAPPELSATAATGALLALQDAGAAPPPEPPATRARRRAGQALEEMRGLQLDLLRGATDPGRLDRLERLAAESPAGLEPELAALVQQVRLRARLEIARRTVAQV